MKNTFYLFCLLAFVASCTVKKTSKTEDKHRTEVASEENALLNNTITKDLVTKHLYTLASDEMEGRKAGTPGIEKAAQYIEREFKRIGLDKLENLDGYRQNFTHNDLEMFNVMGVLKGKTKPQEFVVISAHYDHLGIKEGMPGDNIFNGADDDASGVTAVLSLAEYFKKKDDNARTILFIAFTAEEMGLIGSTHFGKGINAEDFAAGINIEMIGKESSFGPKTAWLTGFDRSDFGKIIQKNLVGSGYALHPDPFPKFQLFFRSDNAALARLGIPAHTFSTGPIDKDPHYHKASDEAETLNMSNIAETIKAIALGTQTIISGDDTPTRVVLK